MINSSWGSVMRSKLRLVLVMVLILPVFGCSDWLDGQKKKDSIVDVSDPQLAALNKMPVLIRHFVASQASEAEIREGVSTLRLAFAKFRDRTRGSRNDAYSAEDMRHFFKRHFIKQAVISGQLAEQFMLLKKALFGGSDTWMTKAEIGQVIDFLQFFEDEAVHLGPFMKVLLAQETAPVTESQLNAATTQLQKSFVTFLEHLDLSQSDYSFENAREFLNQIGLFAAGSEHFEIFTEIDDWTPIASSLKIILFGEKSALQGTEAWNQASQTLVALYDLGLHFHYLIVDHPINGGPQMDVTLDFYDKLLSLLENCKQMKDTGRIPFEHLDGLIHLAGDRELLPFELSVESIEDAYRTVVGSILDPSHRGSTGVQALERIHLATLRREFSIFKLNQQVINSVMAGRDSLLAGQMRPALSRISLDQLSSQFGPNFLEMISVKDAALKFQQLMVKDRAIMFSTDGRLVITSEPEKLYFTWKSLLRANIMYALTRGFLMGYGDQSNPTIAGMREAGFIHWYKDFTKFGVEIHAFDPRSPNAGSRSFKEASFFTFGGAGGDRVAFDETFEYISFLITGGLGNGEDLRTDLESAHCATKVLDVFGKSVIDPGCLKIELRKAIPTVFNNLPGLAAEVKAMNSGEWDELFSALLSASRGPSTPEAGLDSSDLRTMTMILHYSESLFVVNDTNRDNLLEEPEILAGAPRFISFLRDLSPVKLDGFVQQAFLELVLSGVKPGAKEMADLANHLTREKFGWEKPAVAHRVNIYHIFANLKADLSGSGSK